MHSMAVLIMTMNTFDESKIRRGQPHNAGQFAAKHNSAPAAGLSAAPAPAASARPTREGINALHHDLLDARRGADNARLHLTAAFGKDYARVAPTNAGAIIAFQTVADYEATVTPRGTTHTYKGETYARADDLPRAARKARRVAGDIESRSDLTAAYLKAEGRRNELEGAYKTEERAYIGNNPVWDDPDIARQVSAGLHNAHDMRTVNDYLDRKGETTAGGLSLDKLTVRAYQSTSRIHWKAAEESTQKAEERIGTDIVWEAGNTPVVRTYASRPDGGRGDLIESTLNRDGTVVHHVGFRGNRKPYTSAADLPAELGDSKQIAERFEQSRSAVMSARENRAESDRLDRRARHFE